MIYEILFFLIIFVACSVCKYCMRRKEISDALEIERFVGHGV